jgi:hypothetical protein
MTRLLVPLSTPDVSAYAKTLKSFLDERHAAGKTPPTHLELLNLLARAAGLRNFATLKATAPSAEPGKTANMPMPPASVQEIVSINEEVLSATARKTLSQFDAAGRLMRLPNKLSVQQTAMWAIWTQFAAGRSYTEKEVNAIINQQHTFGDQATLRRELINMKLLGRKSDCSEYWKEARRPDDATRAFLHAWRQAHAVKRAS